MAFFNNPNLASSNYILNIVELQNTVTSAGGASPFNVLSNQVAQIQQMVNYDQKRVSADSISAFTSGGTIQVVSPINLSNVTLTTNGVPSSGSVSSLGAGTATLTIGDDALVLQQAATSTMIVQSTGNATFTGTVTAQGFITVSDRRAKENIRPITDYETILSGITGVRYDWRAGFKGGVGASAGIIAQDVLSVFPEAVKVESDTGHYGVAYDTLVPVLIEAVKALQRRVDSLELAAAARP